MQYEKLPMWFVLYACSQLSFNPQKLKTYKENLSRFDSIAVGDEIDKDLNSISFEEQHSCEEKQQADHDVCTMTRRKTEKNYQTFLPWVE